MASLTLIFIKYLFIRIYFCGLNKRTNHECMFLCGFLLLSSFGSTASHFLTEREAFVTLEPEDIGGSLKRKANKISVIGTYAKIGSTGEAHGTLLQIPEDECGCDDSLSRQKKPRNWVALLHYPSEKSGQTTAINDTQCAGVIDRMRNVMMFGASAILILVMNPKIVKELDVPLMISQPIVLIQTATNVSAILEALINHVSVKVKIVAKQVESPQTVTVWSTCWRPRPGSGVVCHSSRNLSKSDPGNFWNYFFSLLATFILLMILKNKSQGDDDWYPMDQGQVLQHMAKQALAVMTIRRFKVPEKPHQHSANNRDICAICLENFFPRQRLRVLPCFHEFHTKCVDPWLLIHPTCPLCKLNILDLQLK